MRERLGLLTVAAFLGFCLGCFLANHCNSMSRDGKTVTDTIVVRDTVRDVMPTAKDSVVTGTIKIPLVLPKEPTVPKAEVKVYDPKDLDSLLHGQEVGKTDVSDTVWATVPRTQKRYEDSTYTAWVSGYEPRLDSIFVVRRTERIVTTQTVTKRNRFSVGLTGGFGYGLFNKNPDVFVGVGVTWRIF